MNNQGWDWLISDREMLFTVQNDKFYCTQTKVNINNTLYNEVK